MSITAPTVLIDENIPRGVAEALASEGITVVSAIGACMGQSDDYLLEWASRERWVLVTGDLDFPRLIFAERRSPPLLLVVERRQPCNADRFAKDLLRVLRLGQRLHGHVIVFDGDDERVRAFPE